MNEKIFIPTGNWDNHKILLRLALDETNYSSNPILELGCGDGSSPALKEFCWDNLRECLSYDYDEEWAKKYGANYVKDWDLDVDWNRKYSVALVDESPGEQRHLSLMLLKNTCDIVIVHDSEPAGEEGYRLNKIWNLYKYKVDLVSRGAWATAMSNTIDVTEWAKIDIQNTEHNPTNEYKIKPWEDRNKIAFCSVAFGEQYIEQQDRLKESILAIYPDAALFFYKDTLPQGAKPFTESLYGFKAYAIKEAKDYGFKRVVWVDTAMILKHELDYPEEIQKSCGVMTVRDINFLSTTSSLAANSHFKLEDLHIKNLVGGSFYFFNFKYALARLIFDDWLLSELLGLFGNQQEESEGKLNGHRHDEACMAAALYKNGVEPINANLLNYEAPGTDTVWIEKKHFK